MLFNCNNKTSSLCSLTAITVGRKGIIISGGLCVACGVLWRMPYSIKYGKLYKRQIFDSSITLGVNGADKFCLKEADAATDLYTK